MRLLVIEDDPDLNRQLATALTDAGYVVDRAFDGEEGHYLGVSEPYDAVILDIGLPKINGHDAARRIRNLPGGQNMVLVAVTGWAQDEDRQKSRESGFDGHMIKPVKADLLTSLLAEFPSVESIR